MKRALFFGLSLVFGCHEAGLEDVRKGHVFFRNGDLERAEHHYRAAIQINQENPSALEGLGSVAFERNQHRTAKTWFEQAAAADPAALSAQHKLAVTLSALGEVDAAIEKLQQMLKRAPRDALTHHALGGLYQRTGKLKEAEHMQRLALSIRPNFPAALLALAKLKLEASDFEAAETIYTRLAGRGHQTWAAYGRAQLAAQRGDYEEAASQLGHVLKARVQHPKRILDDKSFTDAWAHPAMARVRRQLKTVLPAATPAPKKKAPPISG